MVPNIIMVRLLVRNCVRESKVTPYVTFYTIFSTTSPHFFLFHSKKYLNNNIVFKWLCFYADSCSVKSVEIRQPVSKIFTYEVLKYIFRNAVVPSEEPMFLEMYGD